jgi:tRNA(Ile)-lysidine synthase
LVHPLAAQLVSHIRRHELLRAGDRVGAAVSGGIDSVALLRLLLELRGELGIVLSVVHFNHKLRGAESEGDQTFVADLAHEYDLEFLCDSEDVAEHAAEEGVSLEAAARELRYGFFRHLLGEGGEGGPQGLKPDLADSQVRGPEGPLFHGAAETVPFPDSSRGARGPLCHNGSDSVPGKRDPSNLDEGEPSNLQTRHHSKLDKIVTGHTLDDQAETVLMRVIRGTGVTGLGGIYPRIPVENDDGEVSGEIVRPLLANRRRELERYLKDIAQVWREDSTNSDHAFTRNRLRKLVLPLLEEEFNPAVAENLAELAEIARGEEEYWENEVAGWIGTAVHWIEPEWAQQATTGLVQISPSGNQAAPSVDADLQSRIGNAEWLVANASVSRPWFLSEPTAVQRRVVKAIGEHGDIPLEFKHVEEILRFAAEEGAAGRELSLPLGWKLLRHAEELLFVTPDLREEQSPQDYEHELPVPGSAVLPEIGTVIEAHQVPADTVAEYNPDQLLDAETLPGPLRVRNWRAGDRFWPAHTKSPKKVKELLQERHVAQPERALWPVVLSGDEIVWVRGFAAHAKYRARAGREAALISERSWPQGSET